MNFQNLINQRLIFSKVLDKNLSKNELKHVSVKLDQAESDRPSAAQHIPLSAPQKSSHSTSQKVLATPSKTPFKKRKNNKQDLLKNLGKDSQFALKFFDRYLDLSKYQADTKIYVMIRDWSKNLEDLAQHPEIEATSSEIQIGNKSQNRAENLIDTDFLNISSSKNLNFQTPISTSELENLKNQIAAKTAIQVANFTSPPEQPLDKIGWVKKWRQVRNIHLANQKIITDKFAHDFQIIENLLP